MHGELRSEPTNDIGERVVHVVKHPLAQPFGNDDANETESPLTLAHSTTAVSFPETVS